MGDKPIITSVEIFEFWHETQELGTDYAGFNSVYEPGARGKRTSYALRINSDAGVAGEFVGGGPAEAGELRLYAQYLIGKNALEREKVFQDVKRALRKYDKMSMGLIDIALWAIDSPPVPPVWDPLRHTQTR